MKYIKLVLIFLLQYVVFKNKFFQISTSVFLFVCATNTFRNTIFFHSDVGHQIWGPLPFLTLQSFTQKSAILANELARKRSAST